MKRIVSAGAALLLFFFWACATDGAATAPGDLSSGSGDSRPGGGDTDPDTDSGNADGGAASWSLDEARQTAAGLYKGIMPYPGSEGLETVIQLRQNGTYMIRSRVVGKVDNPVELTGTFDIDRNWIVRLDKTAVDTVSPVYVLDPGLEPPTLTQLDNEAKPFSGDGSGRYVLKKFPAMITETYWKLVSIYGRQVVWTGDPKREPHIILRLDGYKISGHSGTNSFSGTYKVKDGNGISFPPMRSTMIASPNMKIEMDLYKAFDETDSYTLHENRFSIGKRGREPSAVFEAVYLR
ncbi:MAG: META domain-containing protein [Spirochaetia bacterium]|jgi:heat shock protein HslJ|nr:META domain-containing protein [Spirochaetia bacterium]